MSVNIPAQIGRPRKYDENEVLTNIMSVFWKDGYEGTALAQIIKATGLQKGSLYKAFKNKHDMYLKALEHYEKNIVQGAVAFLVSDTAPPFERLKAYLSAPIDAACDEKDWRGCFLCNAAADYAAHDEETRALVARGYDKLERALMVTLTELHPEWTNDKVKKMAQLGLSNYVGLRIMSRANVERGRLEGARDTYLDLLL